MLFSAHHDRLRIRLRIVRQGCDVLLVFSGGSAHLGAVALVSPHSNNGDNLLILPGHREDALVLEAARNVSARLGCSVCVCAGIHYDAITPEEIQHVETMVRTLTEQCITALTKARLALSAPQ